MSVLDLYGSQLADLTKVEIGDDVEEIDLTENRLKAIDERIVKLEGLKKISFRKNLLGNVEALEDMKSAGVLVEMVLYDNLIKRLPSLHNFKVATKVDFSYNKIRSMELVAKVSDSVEELYLASNKISEIESIEHLSRLTLLELGCNRIRNMERVQALGNLKELWLGKNKIEEVSGLATLTNLTKLSIQNNRLTKIDGLATLANLEELYLSFNGLTKIEGLESLTSLTILDLASNQIKEMEGLETLVKLEDLWLDNNKIKQVQGVETLGELRTLYLEGNPVKREEYRSKVIKWLPKLEKLDMEDLKL
ncbi:LRRcap domain-containing protein [Chloropicon primus]|uniref:U2A'/phosphoprotein 32 family A C-terminal domain-containing protein n=2 Tax=Chloropicon primus TaxID=1764295 RepID=A0A5B8MSA4_9CHLO|nr:hypothetical protein A3770_07p46900 [Chloropicon primus]UPR01390.1 LRRcap domain-containing protein [Chloropicon primus]|mmetsp:Transcript_602/g.1735  ORF Transcript_602/g.1735 Transcript_602/m.1735 type:complete len:307 (+) Transcript_602:209-1129(+)|eukprot:QDZ22172.1 hypothetical protein A3770_07p46900 [Chloropicon primus]